MWPSLRTGDLVNCLPLTKADPSPGDVMVARIDGRFIVHRLIRRRGNEWVLRGDNCAFDDPPVSPQAVIGVVQAVRRGDRVLQHWNQPSLSGFRIRARVHARLKSLWARVGGR